MRTIRNTSVMHVSEKWMVDLSYKRKWKYHVYIEFQNVSGNPVPFDPGIYHFMTETNFVCGDSIRCNQRTIHGIRQGNCIDFQIVVSPGRIESGLLHREELKFESEDLTYDEDGIKKISLQLCNRKGRKPSRISFVCGYRKNFKRIKPIENISTFSRYEDNPKARQLIFEFEELPAKIVISYKLSWISRILWKVFGKLIEKLIDYEIMTHTGTGAT